MPETCARAALALQAWLSPSYPVGGYAYSHGLETAVENGSVNDLASLSAWASDNLRHGSGWNDAVIFCETFRRAESDVADNLEEGLREIAELASVMTSTAELRLESLQQGAAFLAVTRKAWPHPQLELCTGTIGDNTAYPVCFAAAASVHGCNCENALSGYLFAQVANWVSAAVRMNVVGQTAGQILVAQCAPLIENLTIAATSATLDDMGGCAFLNEIASFNHETQNARLFRS